MGVVGGVDMIFDVLIVFGDGLCKVLFEFNIVKMGKDCLKVLIKINLKDLMDVLKNGELCIGFFMGDY